MSDATMEPQETPPTPERSRRSFRWGLGLLILAVGLIAQAVQWNLNADDRTTQIFVSYIIVPATALALLIWWLFLSGLSWTVRLSGTAVAAIAVAVLFTELFDGFNGDMLPRFVIANRPVGEEAAAELWRNQAEQGAASPAEDAPAEETLWQVDEEDWPDYRGPNRDGVVTRLTLKTDWDASPPEEVWTQPIGAGWSSYTIVDGYAWTQEQLGSEEVVSCYELETGRPIWKQGHEARFSEAMGGDGPRATPVFRDGRIYALGATGILDCLDARTGAVIWTRQILEDAGADNIEWGMAGSPLVLEDRVIVNGGGNNGKSVTAYHLETGEILWQSGSRRAGYTAPRLATFDGVEQVLVFDGEGIGAFLPDDGTELWFFPWTSGPKVNAAQPIPLNDHQLVIGTGYSVGGTLLTLTHSDGDWSVKPEWESRSMKWKFNAAVRQGDYAFGLDDGILSCVDLTTGKRQWKRGRFGYGQLLLVGQHLLVLSEQGDLVLVAANPEKFEQLAEIPVLDGKTWNHPAISGDLILVRNAQQAACYRLPVE